jgi:hypothetical protein
MADQVAEILLGLERDNGRLLPVDVVEAARPEDSPLHSRFEWDDTEAAVKYRLSQARALIRTVKIDVVVHEIPLSVTGYVRDPDADARAAGYRSVVSLRTEEDSARAAIVNEMTRVAAAVRRAKAVAAVLGVGADIEQIDLLARSITERVAPAAAPPPA